MIKLIRESKPTYLSDEKVLELTEKFKSTKSSVWNNNHIKIPLLRSSYGKCAYCECPLTSESNYMEVEHFEDKNHNEDKVVIWENLLPSCKKCNGSKGTHNVIQEPIINPYVDEPKDHLSMRLYRFRGKTDKGKNTIEVTNLNHRSRLVLSRFEIGEKIDELVDIAWERYSIFHEKRDTRSKNKLISVIEGLLEECQPKSNYSASTATNLLTDSKFIDLVSVMKANGLWVDELECLMNTGSILVLDCT
ncbi:HNH endonuclease [Psychrobacter sp. ANT_H56B]|uniref:HNH endonuclease n=1 Tax=Psychrobacter sp. ANT_H56B TaxID=2597353 RepID=UPI0011F3FA6F|nr:HNH endonuclease [Psychrobacter sp. ANT_H56B]KAA0923775.1 HNH endonuclease [Psychrobacter sp. ANT_H56B]